MSVPHLVLALAVPALAAAITFSSHLQAPTTWPSPGSQDCCGYGTRVYKRFQEVKAGLHEDPLNFALINGTTWSAVDRSDHTIANLQSVTWRSDLGPDAGLLPFALLCEDIASSEGYYDMLFEVLDNVDKFPPEQREWAEMKFWVSISDHSLTGTSLVADHGGPNAGIELIAKRLQANPKPYPFIFLGQLTLRYEIQMNLMGLLYHDTTGSRGAAAMRAGIAEELVHTLRTENDLCSPLFTACACMNLLIMADHTRAAKFKELGAPELAANGARRCATPVQDYLMFELSYGEAHPAGQTCGYSATLF